MKQIARINEKILDKLLKKREDDSKFYFVPRKINNKNRLDKGFWFIGNEYYCYVSFWDGTDWKEKIHSIGFVVLDNKQSYIELSAQDSLEKANFLKIVADKIGGFNKSKSKNKWFKHYKGKDFMGNLDYFIDNDKPIIDSLIKMHNPEGIKLLNDKFFDRYIKRIIQKREQQKEIGQYNKIVRVCWNTLNWKRPSGSFGKSSFKESYEHVNGFGNEEWLFDKSKIIDGYQYSFLEPLRLKTNKHVGKTYNLILYTINNLNKKYSIGQIKNVECISPIESERIYEEYLRRGFIEEMKQDIERIGGNWKSFINQKPSKLVNVKFKFDDVYLNQELEEISDEDINITTNRFKLLPLKNSLNIKTELEAEPLSEGNKKNTSTRKRVFNGECEYDPYHDKIQNALKEYLDNTGSYKVVQIEKDRVDIKAIDFNSEWHYYEIKTDSPKLSIRKAIGQIMEYAYYPDKMKAKKLIIISDTLPNEDTITYIKFIREQFKIPVVYQAFDLELKELSKEF